MKSENSSSNNGLRGNLCHYTTPGRFRMTELVLLASSLCLVWISPAIADTTYTVDTIAEQMLAAEAKFTDLRLEYVLTDRLWDRPNGPKTVVEGVYAEKKMAKRLQYLDYKISTVYPEEEKTIITEDILSSFNGQTTLILHRNWMAEQLRPMKGYIHAGYDSRQFPILYMDPHTKVWYFGRTLFGNVLKEHRETFYIESESEVLDGISTVKLVGTLEDGKFTMKLWVSPERNFLPLKWQVIQTEDGKWLSETALYDLVQLPNAMWYPMKIQSPADPPGGPDPYRVGTYNISKISIDPIPEEFFSPEFPPNTHVYDGVLKISYTTY